MNIYDKLNKWLLNYEQLNSWVYFNATPMIVGSVAMNLIAGSSIVKKCIDGSMVKQIVFAIDMVKNYDGDGTSDINMQALDEVNNFVEWLNERNKLKEFPEFSEKELVTSIEVITDIPQLLIDNTGTLAKYQFQVRLIYNDESEVIR